MKKSSAVSARSKSGVFPSPGTPNYRHDDGATGYQKGWSSERVPLPAKSGRRYVSTSALLPFNNGRTLPSKWEDAEKWIFSPVSGIDRPAGLPPHHRRPKSKSGPLATPFEMGYSYSSASPPMSMFDGGRIRNFPDNSPFLTGVLMTERGCCGSVSSGGGSGSEGVRISVTGGGKGSYCAHADEGVVRPASVPGCSDLLLQSSFSLPDQKADGTMDSPVILRKDVATQMSPEDSPRSSPKERLHFSPSPASSPVLEEMQSHFSKLEVRDVQVDDRVTVTRWTKKNISRGSDKGSANVVEWKKKTAESRDSSWEVSETAKSISKIRREEAKITAWENLQKAKAEAAIRKLEMKLEKKRSSSMDKILKKLKSAQGKAHDMRNAAASSQANQAARPSKMVSSFRKAGQMNPLRACFTCHVF
ncbi:unnamed protein product [Spirodela intermedia]|uniref:Remorin C-terminal domain-containing protein n=1 Tax=Spirodela intermedia TaxID=51605 RepID=A0A7I8KUX1_SPIIN|nr:unnamed protein product [Spirodela intermedia]